MTYIAETTRIGFTHIGAFSSIGPDVLIGGLGQHPTEQLSTHPAFYSARGQSGKTFISTENTSELPRTVIGNDVWVGARSIILDGLHIGDGAIIAAGAVVTKSVPPYMIMGGVPARVIRPRFNDNVIAALIDWRWWEFGNAKLQSMTKALLVDGRITEDRVRMLRAEFQER
jgi:acetyltransferase-like isoleucine patch superfamily enzyme